MVAPIDLTLTLSNRVRLQKYYFVVLTSSNFLQISVKALNMAFVGPVTVTILSGHEPSDMLIFAPDCNKINKHNIT